MPSISAFPDVALELVAYLAPKFNTNRFCTSFPNNISVPTARIHRVSGANRDMLVDRPIVDVDVLADDEGDASTFSRAIQAALLVMGSTSTMNGVIQRVASINGPRWLPESNQELVRYGATYEIFIRAA